MDVVYIGYTRLISPKNVMLQLNERDLPVEASPFQVSLWLESILATSGHKYPNNVTFNSNERDLPVEVSPFQVSLWMEFIVSSWDM